MTPLMWSAAELVSLFTEESKVAYDECLQSLLQTTDFKFNLWNLTTKRVFLGYIRTNFLPKKVVRSPLTWITK